MAVRAQRAQLALLNRKVLVSIHELFRRFVTTALYKDQVDESTTFSDLKNSIQISVQIIISLLLSVRSLRIFRFSC